MTKDERGASATEYGLLIAGIAALVVGAILAFGGFVDEIFDDSCDEISAEVTASSC